MSPHNKANWDTNEFLTVKSFKAVLSFSLVVRLGLNGRLHGPRAKVCRRHSGEKQNTVNKKIKSYANAVQQVYRSFSKVKTKYMFVFVLKEMIPFFSSRRANSWDVPGNIIFINIFSVLSSNSPKHTHLWVLTVNAENVFQINVFKIRSEHTDM